MAFASLVSVGSKRRSELPAEDPAGSLGAAPGSNNGEGRALDGDFDGESGQIARTKRGEGLPLWDVPMPRHPHPRPLHTFAPFSVEQVLTLREPSGHLQPFQPAGTPLTFLCLRLAMTWIQTLALGTAHGNSGSVAARNGMETRSDTTRRQEVYLPVVIDTRASRWALGTRP